MKVPEGWTEETWKAAMYNANRSDKEFKPLAPKLSDKKELEKITKGSKK